MVCVVGWATRVLPVEASHVALAKGTRGSYHLGDDAILGFDVVVEVAITPVFPIVPQHRNVPELRIDELLWSGHGNGGQAGEENLTKVWEERFKYHPRELNIVSKDVFSK